MVKNRQKNLIFSIFIIIMMSFIAVLLVSCGQTVRASEISMSENIETYIGQFIYLQYNVEPSNAKYTVEFSSSDPSIVAVRYDGRIEAKDYGTAVITVREINTNLTAQSVVNVTDGEILTVETDYSGFKFRYYEGEQIDPNGCTFQAVYQSGKRVTLSESDYQLSYPEFAVNEAQVIVNFNNFRPLEIDLIVLPDYEVEMNIISFPTKREYFINEIFDPTGMEVELVYASGKRLITNDFTCSALPLEPLQTSVQIECKGFTQKIDISTKARRSVMSLQALQAAINEGIDSISLSGEFNTSTPIIIENASNITIIGEKNAKITGFDIIPIVIRGQAQNVRLYNLTFQTASLSGEKPQNIIDLSECSGGSITLKEITFASSMKDALLLPEGQVDISVTTNNCHYQN